MRLPFGPFSRDGEVTVEHTTLVLFHGLRKDSSIQPLKLADHFTVQPVASPHQGAVVPQRRRVELVTLVGILVRAIVAPMDSVRGDAPVDVALPGVALRLSDGEGMGALGTNDILEDGGKVPVWPEAPGFAL